MSAIGGKPAESARNQGFSTHLKTMAWPLLRWGREGEEWFEDQMGRAVQEGAIMKKIGLAGTLLVLVLVSGCCALRGGKCGGGGGRPTLGEAGGKNPDGLRDALEAGRQAIAAALK